MMDWRRNETYRRDTRKSNYHCSFRRLGNSVLVNGGVSAPNTPKTPKYCTVDAKGKITYYDADGRVTASKPKGVK
jgi:hypothetical protein